MDADDEYGPAFHRAVNSDIYDQAAAPMVDEVEEQRDGAAVDGTLAPGIVLKTFYK